MQVARRLVVHGRVQGVGFRAFTQHTAGREGVAGWVRNLPDGTVEAWLEGDHDAVGRVEEALRGGPTGAHVARVDAESAVPRGLDGPFRVTTASR